MIQRWRKRKKLMQHLHLDQSIKCNVNVCVLIIHLALGIQCVSGFGRERNL